MVMDSRFIVLLEYESYTKTNYGFNLDLFIALPLHTSKKKGGKSSWKVYPDSMLWHGNQNRL